MPFRWRPDGDVVNDLPATRRIMPLIMRRRNESAVFFEQNLDMRKTWTFLQAFRESRGVRATILHLLIFATARTLAERPRLNRFTAGGRIYQRRGIWVSFSAKKGKSDDAPIVVVKRRIDPAWSFETLIHHVEGDIARGRSPEPSATDVELSLLFKLPLFLLSPLVRLVMRLDDLGLLPGAFIRNDPMFASVFIANLGSIEMDAGFHHLYEYGNIPIFITAGKVTNEVTISPEGEITCVPMLTLRYTFDERVEDALYCLQSLEKFRRILEDPAAFIPEGG